MAAPTDTTTTPEPWYCTREEVKRSMDIAETARNNAAVDRAIAAGSRSVETLCRVKHFYPAYETHTFDWPDEQISMPWRLYLNNLPMISVESVVSGGVTQDLAGIFLRPDWGPPFFRIEVSLGTSDMFSVGSTWQRSTVVTGTWGWDDRHVSAGTLAAAVSSTTATTITVSDGYTVGVGSILLVDTERLVVTEKTWTTSGQTLQGALTNGAASTTVAVSDGTQFTIGESILVDSEAMLVVDISGNNLIVKRAYDGSVLASHNSGATVNVRRLCTVVRGALGTTAATHLNAAAVQVWSVPPLLKDLTIAYASTQIAQETANYARMAGAEGAHEVTGRGLEGLESEVLERFGRQFRLRSV